MSTDPKPAWTMEEILQAFGETCTWDSLHIIENEAMANLMIALLRQKGLPEGGSDGEQEHLATEAANAAWARVLKK